MKIAIILLSLFAIVILGHSLLSLQIEITSLREIANTVIIPCRNTWNCTPHARHPHIEICVKPQGTL